MRFLLVCCALVASLSSTSFAAEPGGKEHAKALFRAGSQSYALAEYKKALDEFKAAFRAWEEPIFLYNIAQCHRQLGEPQEAARMYRSYLMRQPKASNRAEVEELITKLEREAAAAKPAPAPEPTPQPEVVPAATLVQPAPPPPKKKRTGLWIGLGVAGGVLVIGAITTAVLLTVPRDAQVPSTSVGDVAVRF